MSTGQPNPFERPAGVFPGLAQARERAKANLSPTGKCQRIVTANDREYFAGVDVEPKSNDVGVITIGPVYMEPDKQDSTVKPILIEKLVIVHIRQKIKITSESDRSLCGQRKHLS